MEPNDYLFLPHTETQKLKADINLDCMRENQSLSSVQARILTSLDKVFNENDIDATIVQGDTMTVLCGALTSFYHKIPVFHVEAGLRSYDIYEPFPEEVMRQMTSRVADLHFAPTNVNKLALMKEGISLDKIYVVGNTVIDALFCLSEKVIEESKKFFADNKITIDDKLVLGDRKEIQEVKNANELYENIDEYDWKSEEDFLKAHTLFEIL